MMSAGSRPGNWSAPGRELRASLALARPDSPARAPILARLDAIDTELLFQHPGHHQRQGSPLLP